MRSLVLTTVLAATVGALDAAVWTFDTTSTGPAISAENARLVLAHRLGLSKYHSLGTANERTIQLLNEAQSPLFSSPAASRKLMIVVEGMEGSLLDTTPSFSISNPPDASSNARLVTDLLSQDMYNRDAANCGKKASRGLIQGGFSSNNPTGFCALGQQTDSDAATITEQLQVLKGDASAMESVFGEPLPPSARSDYTAIFHVQTLEDAALKHGIESSQYKEVQSAIRTAILQAKSSEKFSQMIVVGMPFQPRLSKRDTYGSYEMPLKSRKELPLTDTSYSTSASHSQATSYANRTLPKTTLAVCWSSESACKSNTLGCSGHGSCIKKYSEKVSDEETGAECWACACTPTVLDGSTGKKTIYWGGPACQKKDISVPFFLFAGFTIAALAALSYGVGLLYSIGEEDLPSVLGAGVAPSSRK